MTDGGWQQRVKDLNKMSPTELAAEKVERTTSGPAASKPDRAPSEPDDDKPGVGAYLIGALLIFVVLPAVVVGVIAGGMWIASLGDSDTSDVIEEPAPEPSPEPSSKLDQDVVDAAQECVDGGYGTRDECVVGAVIDNGGG